MERQSYKNQVALLLDVLPEVAKESCFALHGGTAINLFIRNMPRLSVDIDLTYIPIEDRETTFENIVIALERVKGNLEKTINDVRILHQKENCKLHVSRKGTQIKIEVNQTNRGVLQEPQLLLLCDYAQKEYDVFCAIQTLGFGQLFGGKICAALDRQHPRDLFDVKYLLENEGFTEEVKQGFLLHLLCSKRPITEILFPNWLDQRAALFNQFEGMSKESFTYKEFEATRNKLFETIHTKLNDIDKTFILGFINTKPN